MEHEKEGKYQHKEINNPLKVNTDPHKTTKRQHNNSIAPPKESFYNSSNKQCWFKVNRYYAMNFDFFDMEPHSHKEYEIMYVVNGKCKIICWEGNNESQEWSLREGEYVFIDCETRHQLEVVRGSNCRILNLEILIKPQAEGMCLQQFCEQSKSLKDFTSLSVPIFKGYDDAGNLHTIITELHKQLQNNMEEAENTVVQNLILAQFLIEIARQKTKKYHADGGSKYVRKALVYLTNHYDQDIKVSDIAEEIGISVAYLQRLFKEQTGKTLVDKTNELRIEKAKILLETSRLPITDVAISVGFNNRQHFTYTFINLVHCSPAVYRKHKGNYSVWEGFLEQ